MNLLNIIEIIPITYPYKVNSTTKTDTYAIHSTNMLITCWTLLDYPQTLLNFISVGRALDTFVLPFIFQQHNSTLAKFHPYKKMSSLVCWILLDHSENLLDIILAGTIYN